MEDKTFDSVMRGSLPFQDLWSLLNNPREIDKATLDDVISWMRPQRVDENIPFWKAAKSSPLINSKSDVMRKIKEGSIRWNGEKVEDAEMLINFLGPGWGVIQVGKKNHTVVINSKWTY